MNPISTLGLTLDVKKRQTRMGLPLLQIYKLSRFTNDLKTYWFAMISLTTGPITSNMVS